jgi:phage host-nuclease inhibitor protein Gam
MSTKRQKTPASQLAVPQTRAEMELLAVETVKLQTDKETMIAARDKERVEREHEANVKIAACELTIATNVKCLQAWAQANKAEFGDKRSLKAGAATIGWSWNPWKTSLKSRAFTWEGVLWGLVAIFNAPGPEKEEPEAALKRAMRAGIANTLIRKKMEPNKEAMIERREEPEAVAIMMELGVEIIQEETFYVEPDREGQANTTLKAA